MTDIAPADPDDTTGTDPTKFDPTAAPGEDDNEQSQVPDDHDGETDNGGTK